MYLRAALVISIGVCATVAMILPWGSYTWGVGPAALGLIWLVTRK